MAKRRKINPGHSTALAVAERAGVSLTTVSFVLNGTAKQRGIADKTADAVREAACHLRYVPNELARNLRKKTTKAVGVVFPHLRGNWADAIMDGVYDALDPDGYIPLIVNHRGDPDREAKELLSLIERRVDGILCNPISRSIEHYRRVIDNGVPLVFFGDAMSELPEAGFAAWDPQAIEIAVRPLIEAGCQRIAYIGVEDTRTMAGLRTRKFIDTVRNAGLPIDADSLLAIPPETPQVTYFAKLFSAPHLPDGVVVLFDNVAIDVVRYLHSIGLRIPQDVKLATFGAADVLREDAYSITSVSAPTREEGFAAAKALLAAITNPLAPAGRHFVTGGALHKRRSTAAD